MEGKFYLWPKNYMADPSVHVWNGRVYIYPSHDWDAGVGDDDSGAEYEMKDYHVFSTDDLEAVCRGEKELVDHGCILDLKDIPWASHQLWDNDVQEKDGKYFMYFPAKDKTDIFRTGIAVADKPEGPFVPLKDPMHGSYSIDYAVFKDEDGKYYFYFGGIWGGQLQWYKDNKISFNESGVAAPPPGDTDPIVPAKKSETDALPSRVARLADDMLGFAEDPKPVIILGEDGKPLKADDPHRFFEASWMHKYNGKYYFSYSTGDTHMICYAVGDNPYGPFTYKGVVLTPVKAGWTTHHSIIEFKGKWYLFHHDSAPSGGVNSLRSLKVAELHYNEDGTIQTIEG